MYLKFFKLKEEPFTTTSDPRFLFRGEAQQEALDRLTTAITKRQGIAAIVGEPGLGKSTLIRTMLTGLQDAVHFAWVFNTTMESADLLRYICRDFGFTPKGENKADILIELYTFFIKANNNNRIPLLIVDEAQNLDPKVLEEIRQLSNLETVNKKLVQIILSGQPQLDAYLDLPELVQLKQRISYKAVLNRLDFEDTVRYVHFRLERAGARGKSIFTAGALKQVFEISGGIPRLINQVCDNAMTVAAKKQVSEIDAVIVTGLLDRAEVMKAPPVAQTRNTAVRAWELPSKDKAPAPRPKARPKRAVKQEAPPQYDRIIETEDDIFEAIDITELISVV
jgi:general secretion pathway protein A